MALRGAFVLAILAQAGALSQSGQDLHCVGDRPHVLHYEVEGEPNDGSSLAGVKTAVISLKPSPNDAAKCSDRRLFQVTPNGDKKFCFGVNEDSTCSSAKADLSLDKGLVDCKNCFVGITGDLYYSLNYTMTHLHSVEVGMKDMHLRSSVALHKQLSGPTKEMKGTTVIADSSNKKTFDFGLVGCPVCVRAKIEVAIPTTLTYELSLQKDQADFTAGAELDVHLGDRAVKWDDKNGWTRPKQERTVTVKPILDLGKFEAEADMKLDLDTSLQIDVDDIIWFHLNLKPSLPLKCTAEGQLWPPKANDKFCVKGDASLSIGHEADLHWKLLVKNITKHWGPQQDYSWTKSGIVNECKTLEGPKTANVVV